MSLGVRVFLSYARRDASPLAKSVADFLQDKGYEVWRDRPEIRPGQAFMSEIEAAIAKSNVVVALLSPNSVRRQGEIDHLDSVCLDELAFARFSKPPVPIVPVMAVECRPPLEIYRLDYVDLTNEPDRQAGLQRLCDGTFNLRHERLPGPDLRPVAPDLIALVLQEVGDAVRERRCISPSVAEEDFPETHSTYLSSITGYQRKQRKRQTTSRVLSSVLNTL